MKWLPVLVLVIPMALGSHAGNSTPGDSTWSDQAWFLDKDKYNGQTDPHGKGNYAMSQTIPQTHIVTINKATDYFVSNEAATDERRFGRLPWQFIAHCYADDAFSWQIGYWQDGVFTGAGDPVDVTCPPGPPQTGFEVRTSTYTPPTALVVPEGAFVALAISDNDGQLKLRTGQGLSRLIPASDAPDYDGEPPVVDVKGVVSPTDGTVITSMSYPPAAPGGGTTGLGWVRVDVADAAVPLIHVSAPALTSASGHQVIPDGSLRVHVYDDSDALIGTQTFLDDQATISGSFLGTYHLQFEYVSIGAGPNRIMPAGSYTGALTVAIPDPATLFMQSTSDLSLDGPDAPGSAVELAPGESTTFDLPEADAALWYVEMVAEAEEDTELEVSLLDATGATIASTTTTAGHDATSLKKSLAPAGTAASLHIKVPSDGSTTTLWTHAPDEPPSVVMPLLAA